MPITRDFCERPHICNCIRIHSSKQPRVHATEAAAMCAFAVRVNLLQHIRGKPPIYDHCAGQTVSVGYPSPPYAFTIPLRHDFGGVIGLKRCSLQCVHSVSFILVS